MNEKFLFTTSKDYCIDIQIVKDIAVKSNNNHNYFYELLEEKLKALKNLS